MIKYLTAILCVMFFSVAHAQDQDYVPLEERLKSNIFLKVEASNTDCFVGEPIVVTYKLYSALASESSIIRRPSFDGFDVRDLKGSADAVASRETVDGVKFDVHTLLKLQLTPRRAGKLNLGGLTVSSRVRLVNASGKEDPIMDGVKEGYTLNNGYFTLSVSSVPITVLVTELPGAAPKTSTTPNGLVGDFQLDVRLSKKLLAPGEQAELVVMLTGRGDFSKIEQPEISWPEAADVLAAKVDEDKTNKADGTGYKSFTIPFSINAPGKYTIPPIHFSFFDAQGTRFKTITNLPIEVNVVKEGQSVSNLPVVTNEDYGRQYMLIGAAVLILLAFIIWWILSRRKNKPASKPIAVPKKKAATPVVAGSSIDDCLQNAASQIDQPGSGFSTALKHGIVKFVESRTGATVYANSNDSLQQALTQNGVSNDLQTELLQILTTLDMNIYSGGVTETDRHAIFQKTRQLLQQI